MLTCGIMFFSTASWNRGGGGRSTARNIKGEVVDLISNRKHYELITERGIGFTSVYVKLWLCVAVHIGANDHLLCFHT